MEVGVPVVAMVVFGMALLLLCAALGAKLAGSRLKAARMIRDDAVEAGKTRFQTLYRRTPVPMHALNEHGAIEFVSDAWLEVLNYERDNVIGRPLTDFMTSASARQRIEVDWPALLDNRDLTNVEYQFVTGDGRQLHCLLSAHIERDAAGQFVQALCGLIDITARRKAEEQLRQSQKMEAIGHLTGGIAHDFNNLLAATLSNLAMLEKQLPADPKMQRFLSTAMLAAERGAALTQRMLAFSRRQDLRPGSLDLHELIVGMTELMQRSIGPMVRIETDFPDDLPPVFADANQLELAILNLVVNARDAMADGGCIRISASALEMRNDPDLEPGGYVRIAVADEGRGMDAETLAKATEPFFTTKGVGEGTGLGLSMVQGLVAQSGGRLCLVSDVGKGTTAKIYLPAGAAGFAAREPLQMSSEVPLDRDVTLAATSAPARPLRVLAVDDDPLVLMGTVAMVEDLGYEVLEATTGQEALETLKVEEVDLIVTDHAMPSMTGIQLINEIRETRPELPVILASGYVSLLEETDHGLPRLAKPFSQQALAAMIDELVAKRGETGRAMEPAPPTLM
ncbi:response regulator [Jiella endophytica]|uniref:histidine kinase n=1 Tax=Jiella endophytica TaxID=2558362 RepID=A0A4Y8RNT7_9HYPH|nr:ATP-binding protein [Jiella endophytica]TFF24971.1 response regulator [Jiella endophytica]